MFYNNKRLFCENVPNVTVEVVVPQGVMFLPLAITSLVRKIGFMFGGDMWSLLRTEQAAPESSNIVTGFVLSCPCV